MLTKPVDFTCPDWRGAKRARNALNSSMIVACGGRGFRPGKSGDRKLTTQTLLFESRARARGATPTRKVSTLVGSFAGNRLTVSDREFETQTRSWSSMTTSNGPARPAALTILPLFHATAREVEQLIALAVGDPYIAVRRHADAHEAVQLFSKRKVLLASPPDGPAKSITRILPLKLEAQTFSLVTAVPQPIPLIPAPMKPVTGGESVAPSGPNFATPPPMPFTALDCDPASNSNRSRDCPRRRPSPGPVRSCHRPQSAR